jgi:hypothetical protein
MFNTVPLVRYFNPNFREERISDCELRVQVSSTELSLALYDPITVAFELIEKYAIQKSYSGIKTHEAIARILQNNSLSKRDFSGVEILYMGKEYTLVPKALFEEEKSLNFLSLSHKINEGTLVKTCYIHRLEAYLVYGIDPEIKRTLDTFFPKAIFHHYIFPMIEGVFSNLSPSTGLIVHVRDFHFDAILVKDGKIILCNGFEFQTPEDFIYFVLLIYDRHLLNREEIPLYFCGEIESGSSIYSICHKFIRDIFFLKRNESIAIAPPEGETEPLPSHFYFNLLHHSFENH